MVYTPMPKAVKRNGIVCTSRATMYPANQSVSPKNTSCVIIITRTRSSTIQGTIIAR